MTSATYTGPSCGALTTDPRGPHLEDSFAEHSQRAGGSRARLLGSRGHTHGRHRCWSHLRKGPGLGSSAFPSPDALAAHVLAGQTAGPLGLGFVHCTANSQACPYRS